jgi:hypothetical protein
MGAVVTSQVVHQVNSYHRYLKMKSKTDVIDLNDCCYVSNLQYLFLNHIYNILNYIKSVKCDVLRRYIKFRDEVV